MPRIQRFVDEYVAAMREIVTYIPIFYDHFFIPRGHLNLREVLEDAIADSDFTTAFLSPGYVESPWASFEWGYSQGWGDTSERRHSQNWAAAPEPSTEQNAHPILAIRWKAYDGARTVDLFVTPFSIDISEEISRGDTDLATKKAVCGTLRFLDKLYGPHRR
jgi:hypothetical protein